MIKSVLLLLIFAGILVMNLSAQELTTPINIAKSDIFKDPKRTSNLLFAESHGNEGLVIVRIYAAGFQLKTPRGYLVEYYDNDLNLISETEIPVDNNILIKLIVRDGQLFLLEQYDNKKSGQYDYYLNTADLSEFIIERRLIISLDNPHSRFASFLGKMINDQIQIGNFELDMIGMSISDNNKFSVLMHPIKESNFKGTRFFVFDSNFDMVLNQTVPQDNNIKTEFQDILVSDLDGSVYLLDKFYLERGKRDVRRGEINYAFKLYRIDREGITETEFDAGANFIGTMGIKVNSQGLFCVGTYSERADKNHLGIVYFRLNPENLDIELSKLTPFPEQFLSEKYGERIGSKRANREKGIRQLVHRDLFLDDEGSIFFNAEEFYTTESIIIGAQDNFSSSNEGRTIYHYNDIFTAKLNPQGELEWIRAIKKDQNTRKSEREFLSYSAALIDGRMYLFFNAGKRVRKASDGRIHFSNASPKRMNLYVLEVDTEGRVNYSRLLDHKDSKLAYKANLGINSNNGSVLFLEGQRKRNKQIIRLGL